MLAALKPRLMPLPFSTRPSDWQKIRNLLAWNKALETTRHYDRSGKSNDCWSQLHVKGGKGDPTIGTK
jgi:hypothetical protein